MHTQLCMFTFCKTLVLGPIGTTVKAMVTMSPERLEEPFTKPVADVDIGMENLFVGKINKFQCVKYIRVSYVDFVKPYAILLYSLPVFQFVANQFLE